MYKSQEGKPLQHSCGKARGPLCMVYRNIFFGLSQPLFVDKPHRFTNAKGFQTVLAACPLLTSSTSEEMVCLGYIMNASCEVNCIPAISALDSFSS